MQPGPQYLIIETQVEGKLRHVDKFPRTPSGRRAFDRRWDQIHDSLIEQPSCEVSLNEVREFQGGARVRHLRIT